MKFKITFSSKNVSEIECPKFIAQNWLPKFIIKCRSAKDLLKQESAIYHSINLGFDAKVAEQFLNGIY